jgi:hypothetical protein
VLLHWVGPTKELSKFENVLIQSHHTFTSVGPTKELSSFVNVLIYWLYILTCGGSAIKLVNFGNDSCHSFEHKRAGINYIRNIVNNHTFLHGGKSEEITTIKTNLYINVYNCSCDCSYSFCVVCPLLCV